MHHERHPTGRSFDEAEFQTRKLLGNFVGDQIAEGEQRLHTAVPERVIAFDVKETQKQRAAGAGVNQNRQIRIASGLVNGIEVRVIESPLTFDTAKENSDGAVVFA